MEENIIYFYDAENDRVKKEHIFLNNFEVTPFVDKNGDKFDSVEHYYQANKFIDLNDNKKAFEEVRTASSPFLCKKKARFFTNEIHKENWNKEKWENGEKDEVMKRALIFKFSQHPDLLERLIETKESKLVEASIKDAYWGGLLEGSKNQLGNFLMELRENYNKTGKIYFEGIII
jgi:ribA/ribD-fused uncharacterized protein